jgi:hypothetical protein
MDNFNIIVGSNSDFGLHASVADYIASSNIYSPITNLTSYNIPINAYVFTYAGPKAFHLLLALGVTLTGTPAYGIYMILSAFFASLGIFSLYLLCKKFELSESFSILVTVLVMFSQTTVYFYFDNFAPQVLGFSIFPIVLLFTIISIDTPKVHYLILTGLLASFLFSTHPLVSIVYILSISFLVLQKFLIVKYSLKQLLFPLIKIGIIAIILNPKSTYDYVITTIAHSKSYSGGNIRIFPDFSTVINLDIIGNIRIVPNSFVLFFEVFIAILFMYGIYITVKNRKIILLSFLLGTTFYAVGTFIKGAPYDFSKAIPVYFMLICIFSVIAIDAIKTKYSPNKLKIGHVLLGIFVVYTILIIFLTLGTSYVVSTRNTDINNEVNFYKTISNNTEPGSKIYFSSGFLPQVWMSYFVKDADVFTRDDVYTHRGNFSIYAFDQIIINLNSPMDKEIIELKNNVSYSKYIFNIRNETDQNGYLLDKDAVAYLIISKKKLNHTSDNPNDTGNILSLNKKLNETINGNTATIFPYSGWFGHEKYQGKNNFRWTSQNFTMISYLSTERNHTLVLGTLSPVDDNNLTLYINDEPIETVMGGGNTQFIFNIPRTKINTDVTLLKIELSKTFIPDEVIHNGDTRALGLAINRVKIV